MCFRGEGATWNAYVEELWTWRRLCSGRGKVSHQTGSKRVNWMERREDVRWSDAAPLIICLCMLRYSSLFLFFKSIKAILSESFFAPFSAPHLQDSLPASIQTALFSLLTPSSFLPKDSHNISIDNVWILAALDTHTLFLYLLFSQNLMKQRWYVSNKGFLILPTLEPVLSFVVVNKMSLNQHTHTHTHFTFLYRLHPQSYLPSLPGN